MHSPRLLLLSVVFGLKSTATDDSIGRVRIGRWVVIGLAVGIALDLVIGLTIGPIALQARHASSSAHLARVSAYAACTEFNRAKQADLARWDAIVKLLQTGPASPELQTFVAGVEQANKTADQPRDCSQVAP